MKDLRINLSVTNPIYFALKICMVQNPALKLTGLMCPREFKANTQISVTFVIIKQQSQ